MALKEKRVMIPNQNTRKNAMTYFDHQLRSSTTPWVRLSACDVVEMNMVPSQRPKKMPTFARVPLEPVTTMFATSESMISCTLGSAGRKFFRTLIIWCRFAGSVPKKLGRYQRKRRAGGGGKRK